MWSGFTRIVNNEITILGNDAETQDTPVRPSQDPETLHTLGRDCMKCGGYDLP
jgi:hypothetical protein